MRALERAIQSDSPTSAPAETPDDWEELLHLFFPNAFTAPFAPHHRDFWAWIWALQRGVGPRPYINIWSRGGGKTISNECAVVVVGNRRTRRHALIVSETQPQADAIVSNIATRLESRVIANLDPELSERRLNKYGSSKGWRRNRLTTASGLTVQGIGLEKAVRGLREEDDRPDFILFDDCDGVTDTLATTNRKIAVLTKSILPAGSTDVAILGVQNLIIPHGIFARLAGVADEPADFLVNRLVSGPVPAVLDLEVEERFDEILGRNRFVITGGTPSWGGQDLAICQKQMDDDGYTSFLQERQHEVEAMSGGMYGHVDFVRCEHSEVPELERVVLWCDPAVTSNDNSDSQAINADGLGVNGKIYRLFFWEERSSPEETLRKAILKAVELGSLIVGVETDQGGDTWESVYARSAEWLVERGYLTPEQIPEFTAEKAGSGHGPKLHRQQQTVVTEYERGQVVHVRGTHLKLEKALKRFGIKKPYDGADAGYYCVWDLRNPGEAVSASEYMTLLRAQLHDRRR